MQLIGIMHTILKDGGKSVSCFKIEKILFSSHIVEKSLKQWFLTVTFVSPLKREKVCLIMQLRKSALCDVREGTDT